MFEVPEKVRIVITFYGGKGSIDLTFDSIPSVISFLKEKNISFR